MAESSLAKQVDLYLKSLGEDCWFFNVQGGATQKAGVPDRIICYKGKFIGLELKRPDGGGVISPRQKIELRKISEAGGISAVVYNLDELKDIVSDINNKDYLDHPIEEPYDEYPSYEDMCCPQH